MAKANLKDELRSGEYLLIAEMTGYARISVWQQINGYRTLKDKVSKAAEKVIRSRNKLLK